MIDKEKYSKYGNFRGSSGGKLSKYYDFMQIFENKDDVYKVRVEILNRYNKIPNIIGVETFGAMFIAWVWEDIYYNRSFLLKERDHGNRKRFYGFIDNERYTILLDDVITTGTTISEAIEYLLTHMDIVVDEVVVLKSLLTKIDGTKIRVVGD